MKKKIMIMVMMEVVVGGLDCSVGGKELELTQ